jgi:methionyl-tRNA formyltransferase
MRAVVLGNKDLAVGCLDVLLKHEVDVAGVVLNPDDDGQDEGKWYQSLKKTALQKGLSFVQPKNVSSAEGAAYIGRLEPDFLFSFSYSRIVKGYILNQASKGAFNIHFSNLPHHRGCLPLVYALAACDREAGVTLHVMDEGIDTGPIVERVLFPVEETDTAFSLYFECVAAGIDLFDRALPKLLSGEFEAASQDLQKGSYHPQVYPNDRWLSPSLSPVQLSSFVRAHTFRGYPSARALLDEGEYEVLYESGRFMIPGLRLNDLTAHDLHQELMNRGWKDREMYEVGY